MVCFVGFFTKQTNNIGKVQNVYYGQYATLTAKELGIVGYVKSLPDETIEIIAEGSYEQLCQFLRWCHVKVFCFDFDFFVKTFRCMWGIDWFTKKFCE